MTQDELKYTQEILNDLMKNPITIGEKIDFIVERNKVLDLQYKALKLMGCMTISNILAALQKLEQSLPLAAETILFDAVNSLMTLLPEYVPLDSQIDMLNQAREYTEIVKESQNNEKT